jgi:hypothetical protein
MMQNSWGIPQLVIDSFRVRDYRGTRKTGITRGFTEIKNDLRSGAIRQSQCKRLPSRTRLPTDA